MIIKEITIIILCYTHLEKIQLEGILPSLIQIRTIQVLSKVLPLLICSQHVDVPKITLSLQIADALASLLHY